MIFSAVLVAECSWFIARQVEGEVAVNEVTATKELELGARAEVSQISASPILNG